MTRLALLTTCLCLAVACDDGALDRLLGTAEAPDPESFFRAWKEAVARRDDRALLDLADASSRDSIRGALERWQARSRDQGGPYGILAEGLDLGGQDPARVPIEDLLASVMAREVEKSYGPGGLERHTLVEASASSDVARLVVEAPGTDGAAPSRTTTELRLEEGAWRVRLEAVGFLDEEKIPFSLSLRLPFAPPEEE